MTVFETLNGVNVNEHTEKKNGLTYLSWAWAWGELLKRFPDSTYTIYENRDGWCYHTDGKTCWVKTGVTVEGKEYIEMLPVMDFKNRSIPADAVTSFDVNKAIQRSLTKAVARHGLGLYIYAGEDLPEGEELKPEPLPADALQPGEKLELPKAGSWNPKNAIGIFCKRVGLKLADFANLRAALIAGGIVKDIPSGELSPVDFDVLCKAIEANYPELLKVSA
ncbi:MAG: DUF1071 domain-containing protein [Acidaminococcaceae bacterium]|nr:DUF1071 domain-containing protein [Acidaminococcaceae bacterium]